MSKFNVIAEPISDDPIDWNWSKPSLAVCASDGNNGWVPWHCGPHVEMQIDGLSAQLQDLGLDDAPKGISIWEGTLAGGERTYEGDYYDVYLKGTFRAPTDDEWAAIREGRCPWNSTDWELETPGLAEIADAGIPGPAVRGSETHLIHWVGCTNAEPGLPRTSDSTRVTCRACQQDIQASIKPEPTT